MFHITSSRRRRTRTRSARTSARRIYRCRWICYHTQIVEGDIARKLEHWLPHIGHIQIAGVPGRHEPDVGEINYAWLFRRIDELGYDGWVGCEYRPLRDTVSGLAWRRATAAVAFWQ